MDFNVLKSGSPKVRRSSRANEAQGARDLVDEILPQVGPSTSLTPRVEEVNLQGCETHKSWFCDGASCTSPSPGLFLTKRWIAAASNLHLGVSSE
jgi:hypothetical protein